MGQQAKAIVQTQNAPLVSSTRNSLLQRKCACGGSPGIDGECDKCRSKRLSLQRHSLNPAGVSHIPSIVEDVLHSSGQPLDATTRIPMESRFGHDFSKVRVHTDKQAAKSAQTVNALAYTVGKDVVFGAGQYAPNTTVGRKLLAHELTHVVQQRSTSEEGSGEIRSAADRYEQEAKAVGSAVAERTTSASGEARGSIAIQQQVSEQRI